MALIVNGSHIGGEGVRMSEIHSKIIKCQYMRAFIASNKGMTSGGLSQADIADFSILGGLTKV